MSNGITLGKGASLQQVSDQLKNQSNEDGRLLARTNKHGETVLYARPAAKNVFDKISHFIDRQTGRTERREERAREAVYSLVREVTANRSEFSPGLFRELGTAIKQWSSNKQLTGTVLSHISESVRNLPGKPMPSGETLGSLGIARDSDFLREAANRLARGNADLKEVATELGDDLVDEILVRNEKDEVARNAFAISNGIRLVDEMSGVIRDMLAKRVPPVTLDNADLTALCRTAFIEAASKVRDDGLLEGVIKEVDHGLDATGKVKVREMNHIQVGGEEYEPMRRLDAGAFGEVYEFQSVGDPDTKIAVKFTLGLDMNSIKGDGREYSEALRAASEEITMHTKAYGSGIKEVVEIKGHFRMPDGNIAVAMEMAPNGGVHQMGKLLAEAIENHVLTKDEANILSLTMLRDMTTGLEHMHKANTTHLDFKPPNCFIGEDGTVKLGDFGMSLAVDTTDKSGKYENIGKLDSPLYKAPELVESKKSIETANAKEKKDIASRVADAVTQLKDLFPKGTKDTLLAALAANVNEKAVGDIVKRNADYKAGLRFDNKVDVWGLGMTGVQLFSGGLPFAHLGGFDSVAEDLLVDYAANPNNSPLSDAILVDGKLAPKPGSVATKTGNAQIDDLLTRMLRPKASDRDGATQLLRHAAFDIAGVGSGPARKLILAIKSRNPVEIAQAKQALNLEMQLVKVPKQAIHGSTLSSPPKLLVETGDTVGTSNSIPPLPQTPTPITGKTGSDDESKV